MRLITGTRVVLFLAIAGLFVQSASAQPLAKAQVANLIVKVENGVDDFRKYLEQRGENAGNAAANSAKRRGRTASESQKAKGSAKKDQLEDALDELNQSTNRLRRKFDATDTWMETKVQVERVVEDGRKINQVVARGSYGTEAARLWAVLRSSINDLARAYGVTPLAV